MAMKTAVITGIETKEGVGANGRAWKLHRIQLNTGEKISTFDEALANIAREKTGELVDIAYNEEQKQRSDGQGVFTTRDLISIMEPSQQQIAVNGKPAGPDTHQLKMDIGLAMKCAAMNLQPGATEEKKRTETLEWLTVGESIYKSVKEKLEEKPKPPPEPEPIAAEGDDIPF